MMPVLSESLVTQSNTSYSAYFIFLPNIFDHTHEKCCILSWTELVVIYCTQNVGFTNLFMTIMMWPWRFCHKKVIILV